MYRCKLPRVQNGISNLHCLHVCDIVSYIYNIFHYLSIFCKSFGYSKIGKTLSCCKLTIENRQVSRVPFMCIVYNLAGLSIIFSSGYQAFNFAKTGCPLNFLVISDDLVTANFEHFVIRLCSCCTCACLWFKLKSVIKTNQYWLYTVYRFGYDEF